VPPPKWPSQWQPEAIEAVAPYVDSDAWIEVLLDDPQTAVHGTLLGGFVFTADDGSLKMIWDKSEQPGVYPWPLLRGPVLVVKVREPGRRLRTIYRHPEWTRRP
jgi:hypothetical protein